MYVRSMYVLLFPTYVLYIHCEWSGGANADQMGIASWKWFLSILPHSHSVLGVTWIFRANENEGQPGRIYIFLTCRVGGGGGEIA